MKNPPHYLIIGAGLSGITVAAHLIKRNQKVTLIDNGVNHSSIIAAGMINPLVFRRMNKGWRVDDCMPYLREFYTEMEGETDSKFFHPIQIRRMFSTEQERDLWLDKQELSEFESYMFKVTEEDNTYDKAINKFGSGRLKQGAYVNTEIFLSELKEWIANKANLLQKQFEYNKLTGSNYDGLDYDHIIFCEGYMGVDNPWFGNLPLGQNKGETLTIESDAIPEDESVNRKCFILPLGKHQFKVGSTYEWNNNSTEITEEGRNAILEKMSYLTDAPIKVIDQGAGVRPTVSDRRPLIGTHPEYKNYHIFNGLGTKGYLLAPLMSKEFVDYLIEGKELHPEVNINRFNK